MAKISVIIPVYNVEHYLCRIISDLLNQDTNEIYEIILVDDGSTDKCGDICDKYAKDHTCIKVFHKENSGLSDARNYGVQMSNGEYITFVDPDDRITQDYIKSLYDPLRDNNFDLCVGSFKRFYDYEEISLSSKYDLKRYEIYSNIKPLLKHAILGKKGSLSACGKMYKRDMLLKHPFPSGKLYEDMEVIYNIYNDCKNAVYNRTTIYYYLQRNNSIVNSKITEIHLYGIQSCKRMLEIERNKNGDLINEIKTRIVMQACGHLPNLCSNNDIDMFKKIKDLIYSEANEIIFHIKSPIKLKLKAIAYILPSNIALNYANILFKFQKNKRIAFYKLKNKLSKRHFDILSKIL